MSTLQRRELKQDMGAMPLAETWQRLGKGTFVTVAPKARDESRSHHARTSLGRAYCCESANFGWDLVFDGLGR